MKEYINTFYHKLYLRYCNLPTTEIIPFSDFINMNIDLQTEQLICSVALDIIHEFPIIKIIHKKYEDHMLKICPPINGKDTVMLHDVFSFVHYGSIHGFKKDFNRLLRLEKIKKLRQ